MARTDPRPNYGSKRRVRSDGYIDLWKPGHPCARNDGYVFEHRFVAWEAGLLVDPSLDVHHRNEVRDDNRVENLEVVDTATHTRLHGLQGSALRNALKTHCPSGHEYTPENTYTYSYGRWCKTCAAENRRRYLKRKREREE